MIGLSTLRLPLLRTAACVVAFATLNIGTAYSQLSDRAAALNASSTKKIVKQIQIQHKGAASVSDGRIRAQMSLHEGGAYSDESVEQDIRNLYATGAIENVEIKAESLGDGVRVIVTITGRGSVGEINFRGNTIYDNNKLVKETEIKTGDPVDESKLAKAAQKIRERYEKNGYADVSVNYETAPLSAPGFTRVTFVVSEGERGLVRNIYFEGNKSIKATVLHAKMTLKEKALWRVWRGKSGRLADEALTDDVKAVEGVYHDAGYVYAKVTKTRRTPVGKDYVDLTMTIFEGDKYNIDEVVLSGITVFTVKELSRALKTAKGFAYSGSDVHDDEKMIGDYYGSRGYADSRVETSIVPVGNNKVKVVYHVVEGEKSFIGKVNIAGNTISKDNVIRRELPFAPGEELNTVKVEAGKSRLQNLGYFSQVDIRNNPSGQPGVKDIDVAVTEQSTGTINFGAGFSSIDSLVGFVDLTQTNFDAGNYPSFRGAGQRFHVGIQYGTLRRDFTMSFTEPWFLDQKLAFTTELFYHDLYYLSTLYDQQSYGVSFNLRKPLGEHSYAEMTYTVQDVTIHNVQPYASDLIKQEAGSFLESKIDFDWVNDTRDSVYITRSGHKVTLGGMVGGSFLGGDVSVYGMKLQGTQYFHLPWDGIFSIDGAINTVDAIGSGRVPIFERLFLGGANDLRGFAYRKVGPKDFSGEPLGGLTSAFTTFEYTFPIMEKLRGAVFYDVGMVSGTAYDLSGTINADVGIGLRLYLPIGPIRVDFGVPVQADSFNDSSGHFNFNVGYKF